MKKLSLYVFLALFFCNAGIAQELIKIPVHVHIVQIEEGDYKTITTPEDVREDFKDGRIFFFFLKRVGPPLSVILA